MIHFKGETASPCDKYQITLSSQEQSQQVHRPVSGLGDSDGKKKKKNPGTDFHKHKRSPLGDLCCEHSCSHPSSSLLLSFSSEGNKVEESLK